MSDTYTVDDAAELAGCNPREFGHRAKAAGVLPIYFKRVDGRMRGVYAAPDVEVVIHGGPGSRLAFDLVAADLGMASDELASIVVRRCPGFGLAVPARYRNVLSPK